MAYFDNAATSYPKPEIVYAFMDSFYRNHGGSAGRGNYALSSNAKGIIDETRNLLQNLLHCPSKQVIFTPTATVALNMIIQGIIFLMMMMMMMMDIISLLKEVVINLLQILFY